MKRLALHLIQLYQRSWSGTRPPACRFAPSCSHYTYEAIEKYGFVKGVWLGLRRLARCHPFSRSGYDPVP